MKPIFYGQRLDQGPVKITPNVHFAMCHDLNWSCAPFFGLFIIWLVFWFIVGDIHHSWANLAIVENKIKQREDIHGENWKQNSKGTIAQNNVPTFPLLEIRTSPKNQH